LNQLLFLCTGNYYRSRFAEYYFRDRAIKLGLPWQVTSRALAPSPLNVGPLSQFTIAECAKLGLSTAPLRLPLMLNRSDLQGANLTIAVKEAEHRPLMAIQFPDWEDRIEYWHVHDLDCASPAQALPQLRALVDQLLDRLVNEPMQGT
jgi:protein-tyrosine phosphatase